MKQVELVGIKEFEYQEVEIPKYKPNEVLIKVEAFGICGSDVASYTGTHPFVNPPIVLGHEYSGIVEAVGDDVTGIQVGQRVTSEIVETCGNCYACLSGRYQLCVNGKYLGNVKLNGAMAEYLVMDGKRVHSVPDNMTAVETCLVEPLAVAFHAVRLSDFKVGDVALVLGAGVIGNLTAQVLLLAGARTVIVSDVLDSRLDKLEGLGVEMAVNSAKENLIEKMRNEVGSGNLDIIFDCVGSEQTLDQAIEVAKKGSQIIMVGVPPTKIPVNMAYVQDRELSLIGSLQYVKDDYVRAIDAISKGRVDVNRLVTHIFEFKDYQEAFDIAIDSVAAEKGRMKVLIKY